MTEIESTTTHDGRAGSEPPANKARAGTPYPLHPVCFDYEDFTKAESATMRESLRKLGLLTPIALWRSQIVDGRHRDLFCRELGIEPRYDDLTDRCPTEAAMRAYVAALNEHRRSRTTPLTVAEKQARIDAALKAAPDRSDRAIAEEYGVSQPFVSKRRRTLKTTKGDNVITPPAKRRSRRGKVGEGQRRKKQPQNPIQQPPQPQQAEEAEPQQQEPQQTAPVAEKDKDAAQRDPEAPVAAAPLTIPMFPVAAIDPPAGDQARACRASPRA